MMYMGHEGLYSSILNNEKNPDCSTCHLPRVFEVDGSMTLEAFYNE